MPQTPEFLSGVIEPTIPKTWGLGCRIQPLIGVQEIEPFLGAPILPENYIVPAYRYLFNENFSIIPAEAAKFIKDQGPRPSCVGQSTAYQKQAQESVAISGRDIYRQAKMLDGTDPLSYGTTLASGQDAVVNGACEYDLAPEREVSLREYVLGQPTPEQLANRREHKGKEPFRVTRNQFRQTLFQFETPIVTSLGWFMSDNDIGGDGIMPPPSGQYLGGHAVTVIGWRYRNGQTYLIFPNSFGPGWANNGFFLVPLSLLTRFSDGLVGVDVKPDLMHVLTKYDKQNVKVQGDPNVWRIENGQRHLFDDEIVFFAHGFLFSEVQDILKEDLNTVPEGAPMNIDDAPWRTRELLREIRQLYGKL